MTISAKEVRNVLFEQTPMLKPGYAMDEVDDFLDQVAMTLDAMQASHTRRPPQTDSRELIELRRRVSELEGRNSAATELKRERDEAVRERDNALRQLADQQGSQRENDEISSRAVDLLSQAQASADRTVAEADRYAQELVADARRQFEEILTNAREVAARAGLADPRPTNAPGPDIDHLRSCAEQAQQQLNIMLTKLTPEAVPAARDSGAPVH
ncbi:MAG: DivIVA domain-containing protein [Rhodococcus sp.]|nr:DivIVA domain-containing protein [Rhodococcus sp. (in: high G+C Gram-positive bacteria)]